MSETVLLLMLFAVGAGLLVAEIFIPSHGVLTIAGLGFLIAGVIKTYHLHGDTAGTISLILCMVFVPTMGIVAVKYFRRTWIGKIISPPNPIVTRSDTSIPVDKLVALVGKTGRTVSPLRPVGICSFDGVRISCVAEFGQIEAGVAVQGSRVSGANLAVIPLEDAQNA